MSTSRSILICVSLLILISAGFYLSNDSDLTALVNGANQAASSSASNASSVEITNCAFDTTEMPEHVRVIMSEIAWMGTASSSKDEWIELKNISSGTVSLGGSELVNASGKIKIVFRSGARIPTGGFYLLEKGSNDFLTGIKADMYFVGTLKNTGDSLRLFDRYCALIDQVMASSNWPAGDNATKKTMERDSKTLGWHTSSQVGGTPKSENDPLIKKPPVSLKASKKASLK